MPGGNFLDSNVILYAFDETDERKKAIARSIIDEARLPDFCISFQVVQEVLNGLTRRVPTSIAGAAGLPVLEDVLKPLWGIDPSSELYERAISIRQRYGYAFYDSLIIAAAQEAGCSRLLTEDMQDGQRIEGLLIENPFR